MCACDVWASITHNVGVESWGRLGETDDFHGRGNYWKCGRGALFHTLFLFGFHSIVIYVLLFQNLVFGVDRLINGWYFVIFMIIYDHERDGNMTIISFCDNRLSQRQ